MNTRTKRRSPPRTLKVFRKEMITPHMHRVTLGGPELVGFPVDSDGGYFKLYLGKSESDPDKPLLRTYTVRHFDEKTLRLDVDFVIHESDGPAVNWLSTCQLGDEIQISGPGQKKPLNPEADWVLVIGDMSALPAISVNIERLAPDAKGYALLEIIHEDDAQALNIPENLHVDWIVNSDPEQENSILFDRVKSLQWLPGSPYVWIAGEFNQSLAIRKYLKQEHNITREQMYASSYWQIGQTEDGHKISKKGVADL